MPTNALRSFEYRWQILDIGGTEPGAVATGSKAQLAPITTNQDMPRWVQIQNYLLDPLSWMAGPVATAPGSVPLVIFDFLI